MASTVASPSEDLQERLRFESMLADLSSRFVNLEPAAVDREIEDAQRLVCECLELDMSALWQLSPKESGVLRMTHLYRPLGGPPVPDDFDAREYNPWSLGGVFEGTAVILPSVDEAPPEAITDRETWRYFDIKSVFCFPLSIGGESVIGAVSFHAVREESSWPDEMVQRLQLVSQIFANALVRKRADAALRESEERLQLAAEAAEVGMWMLELENTYLQREHRLQHGSGRIVGESPAIMEVLKVVEQVAPAETTVLVEGETGTGKELIGQRIHELSQRNQRPMVKVNCAALPSTLVESELFGREKGAYTGAVSREAGRFEVADGSTIFLDEVAELPFELQAKLLRVLEEGSFERVGSSKTMQTDVRLLPPPTTTWRPRSRRGDSVTIFSSAWRSSKFGGRRFGGF